MKKRTEKMRASSEAELSEILDEVRRLAVRYYRLTGKPLGVTGEVGERIASDLMGWELAPPREPGFDARKPTGETVQIKTRCLYRGKVTG